MLIYSSSFSFTGLPVSRYMTTPLLNFVVAELDEFLKEQNFCYVHKPQLTEKSDFKARKRSGEKEVVIYLEKGGPKIKKKEEKEVQGPNFSFFVLLPVFFCFSLNISKVLKPSLKNKALFFNPSTHLKVFDQTTTVFSRKMYTRLLFK